MQNMKKELVDNVLAVPGKWLGEQFKCACQGCSPEDRAEATSDGKALSAEENKAIKKLRRDEEKAKKKEEAFYIDRDLVEKPNDHWKAY